MAKKDEKQSLLKKVTTKFQKSQEDGARKKVLEDLFYDFNRSRVQIYKMNFVRGIMMGAGTVIGGTVVIAILVWMLSILANFVPPLGDFFEGISSTLERTTSE